MAMLESVWRFPPTTRIGANSGEIVRKVWNLADPFSVGMNPATNGVRAATQRRTGTPARPGGLRLVQAIGRAGVPVLRIRAWRAKQIVLYYGGAG